MIADYWDQLVGVALLGTDRTAVPAPPPGVLGDLHADVPPDSAPAALVQQVAATVALRRAAVLPARPQQPIPPPDPDLRPFTPPAAGLTFHAIAAQWPVLLPEWVGAVVGGGWRLAPDLVVPVLQVVRRQPHLAGPARQATGPLGDWLIEHWPSLAVAPKPAPDAIPLTPEVDQLLGAPAERVVHVVVRQIATMAWGPAHRAVLIHFVTQLPRATLGALAPALAGLAEHQPGLALARTLAELAGLRDTALSQLDVPSLPENR